MKNALPILHVRDILDSMPARSRSALRSLNKRPRLLQNAPPRPSARGAVAASGRKATETLNEMFSSAILAQDKELAGLLWEVDELLKTIRAEDPETRAVSSALQRTVLCAVKQSLLDKELQSLALTDDMTGLYNRRAFLALATQQVKLVRRQGKGLLLFFADIDKLKSINDSFGHREGDFAIIQAANVLEHSFRDSDIVARLGGDEFAALALDVSGKDQEIILRRLAKNLRGLGSNDLRWQLSLSVGVARLDPNRFVTIGNLMEQADAAMYREKKKKERYRVSERALPV